VISDASVQHSEAE